MSIETRRDVFQAVADPTRRQIIHLIAQKEMNLNAIAENFDISRSAISQHVKILTECGLIEVRQQGRERFCEAKLEKLSEIHDWTEQYKAMWTKKFQSLRNLLDTETQDEKKKQNKHL